MPVGLGHGKTERGSNVGAENFIRFRRYVLDRAQRGSGNGHNRFTGPGFFDHVNRGQHGETGGQTVIHQNDPFPGKIRKGATPSKQGVSIFKLASDPCFLRLDLRVP